MKSSPLLDRIPDYPFRKVGIFPNKPNRETAYEVINARIGIPDKEARRL